MLLTLCYILLGLVGLALYSASGEVAALIGGLIFIGLASLYNLKGSNSHE